LAELIHTHSATVVSDGIRYRALIYGQERPDGTWVGWIEFLPIGEGAARRTEQETSQPNRKAVEYWASGIEPLYLDGALARSGSAGE
jgi:hypothetical protein